MSEEKEMSPEEFNKLTEEEKLTVYQKNLVSIKAIGATAKETRERIEELQSQDEARVKFKQDLEKSKEKDMEALDLLKKRDDHIETLIEDNKNLNKKMLRTSLVSKATVQLVEQGFRSDLIEVGLPKELTEDNFDESVKSFEAKFADYKVTETEGIVKNDKGQNIPQSKANEPKSGDSATKGYKEFIKT